METKSTRKIRKLFRKSFDFSTVICYKNPSKYTQLNIERVNPDHVGIIWGKKRGKGNNTIKIGKVYFSFIPLIVGLSVVGWLDAFTGYSFRLLLNIGLLSMVVGVVCGLIIYLPFIKLSLKGSANLG